MLNEKKIKIMVKLAEYEQNAGKEELDMGKYYKSDYIRLQILKNAIYVTLGYALILLILALYNMEYLISHVVNLNYQTLGIAVLAVYILILVLFTLITVSVYSLRYDRTRKHLQRYYNLLRMLGRYYENKGNESDN